MLRRELPPLLGILCLCRVLDILFKVLAAHDCRGHGKEKDGHADDRTNDSCDSFHNAVSLPRWDSGTV